MNIVCSREPALVIGLRSLMAVYEMVARRSLIAGQGPKVDSSVGELTLKDDSSVAELTLKWRAGPWWLVQMAGRWLCVLTPLVNSKH